MKISIHTDDITRIKSLVEALEYSGNIEIEIDGSSGIGNTVTAHVPTAVNCLKGIFSYEISGSENW